jgi:hypothetical protein
MNQLTTLSRLLDRHSGVDGKHSTAIAGLKLFRLSAPTLPAEVSCTSLHFAWSLKARSASC